MDRPHVALLFDSVIDQYSTAKSGELLCTLQEEQGESAANGGVLAMEERRCWIGCEAAFIWIYCDGLLA